jgi:DUF4097 and DUF4098 domain-containing protein YvlB
METTRPARTTAIISASALALIAALFAGGRAEAKERVDLEKTAAKDASIRIKNVAGWVKVTGWDKGEVTVNGTVGEGVEKVDLSGEPDHVSIEVILQKHAHDGEAELEIKVPRGSRLRFQTVSADVDIRGFGGPLEGETVSGSIECDTPVKEASLKSVSGNIRLEGAGDRFQLKSVSGDLTVKNASGEANANTVSGSIRISGGTFSRATVHSVSGSIEVDGALSGDGAYEFESHSGSIVLRIPASTSATFDLSTFSGDIQSEMGQGGVSRHGYGPGREAHFTLGQDGARVSVKSFSGSVSIRKRG